MQPKWTNPLSFVISQQNLHTNQYVPYPFTGSGNFNCKIYILVFTMDTYFFY